MRSATFISLLAGVLICPTATRQAAAESPSPRPNTGGIDRFAGMPVVHPTPIQAAMENPEDAYWDNRISPAIAGVDYRVAAIATYQGKLVVGGFFSIAGGVVSPGIAAWNGSTWSSLESGAWVEVPGRSPSGGSVQALAVYDGKLIAAGGFDRIDGVSAPGIAAWDGSSWTPLGSGVYGGGVSALAVYDGKLIAGGSGRIVAWDGSSWASLGSVSPASGRVTALTVYEDKLIAGGTFDAIGGVPAKKIAAWDSESWAALGPGLTASTYGGAYALTVHEDRLIAGGDFTAAGATPTAHLAAWDGASWSALGTGAPWYVFGLTIFGGRLIAGGGEDTSSGRELRLVSWDGGSWTSVIPASEHLKQSIYCLGISGNRLVVGGEFRAVGGVPAASVAAWDGTGWSGFAPDPLGVSDPVLSLADFDGRLIAGGTFISAGPGIATRIAAWDGATWSSLGYGVWQSPGYLSPFVSSLSVFQGKLVAGGMFMMAGDAPAIDVAAWDGSSWSPMTPEFDTMNWVNCLNAYASRLLVSEAWPSCNDLCERRSEALVAYWEDTSLFPVGGFNRPVSAFTTYGNRLVAGGEFTRAGYQPANHIAAWDGQTWAELGGGTNGIVSALAVFRNELIAAGLFTSAGGVPARNIAAWDGDSWSALGDGVALPVNALAVYDGNLIVGGGINFYVNQGLLAAWDGESWSPLGSGTNGTVHALAVHDRDLVVAGNFTMAGGKVSPYLALWTKKDTREVSMDIRPGTCPNPINVGPAVERGQAVVPVAILGTEDFDVREIDPGTVTLEGISPLRWNYTDVAAPADKETGDCTCTRAGPDGYEDLGFQFARNDLIGSLETGEGVATPIGSQRRRLPSHESYSIRIAGRTKDNSAFEGFDCILIVGRQGSPFAPGGLVGRLAVRNSPGPLGSSVEIRFRLTQTSAVRLGIYDIVGRKVASLLHESRGPGEQSVTWDGSGVASGVYYCRLQAGKDIQVGKVVLLK